MRKRPILTRFSRFSGFFCVVFVIAGCWSSAPIVGDDKLEAKETGLETGRWHPVPDEAPQFRPVQREALERLEALPYLAASQSAPASRGVTRLVADRVQSGLNLFNSGHRPEASLMDLEGRVLHTWSYPIEQIWPQQRGPHQSSYWRRATWLPDGGLLAIFEGLGLIRLDKDSNLLWARQGQLHHQVVLKEDGTLFALTRKSKIVPRINPSEAILEDYLVHLTAEGEFISEFSLLQAFERSQFRPLLEGMKRRGDIFHTNSIQIVQGSFPNSAPWLREGNLLISILFLDTICVLDPERQEVVWALRGDSGLAFRGQHDARLLPNGNLLLFDNWGRLGKSRVLEFDPLSQKISWQYPDQPESDFFTATCGTSQRLSNGNTLITESEKGRAIELTPEGEIVWEFFNPHRGGQGGELIATLFETRRIPEDFFAW